MNKLFDVKVDIYKGLPRLHYQFRNHSWKQLQKTLIGKTVLFTDNHDWSDVPIVRGYRVQYHIEDAYRDLKNSECIALRP